MSFILSSRETRREGYTKHPLLPNLHVELMFKLKAESSRLKANRKINVWKSSPLILTPRFSQTNSIEVIFQPFHLSALSFELVV